MDEKLIKISCEGADSLPIESFSEFQGNLKTLSEKEFEKLKTTILKVGFSFPIFVWRNGKENFIIDGHQRLFVVKKMISEGFKIEGGKIPVAWVKAKNKAEAKEKVLLAASQYGKISQEGLYEFLQTEGLDFSEIEKSLDLPQIDLEKFKFSYYEDKDIDFVDQDELLNKFSVIIKCLNEEEQQDVIRRLNLPKPKIYYKDFLETLGEN